MTEPVEDFVDDFVGGTLEELREQLPDELLKKPIDGLLVVDGTLFLVFFLDFILL
jgi:hypothetical protein